MTTYTADLHIHSRYSRATSKALSVPRLAAWAGVKGVDVLAASDVTHPAWLQEIETHLEENGDGLLRLKDPSCMAPEIPWLEPGALPKAPLFILGTEISSIYKSQGQVRKIHNLVFFSSLDRVRSFNRRLSQVGNLESDGRPILGLDSRDLLEMVLETDPLGFLIPAHIWTPWFSLFGSKSGFNRLSDCYKDLSGHIFALETGLSSDPEMNWLWSDLDAYTLVSNSDAHSGEKLAREANLFSGHPSYEHILHALQGGSETQRFLGSIEFFPEEGKYHLDGHRKCGVVLDPRETARLGGTCPVCGGKLTVGVLSRVLDLADRNTARQPKTAPGFTSLIPLPEVLAEILDKGPKTKAVTSVYAQLIRAFGSELDILRKAPEEDLKPYSPLLAEGISRMRRKEVHRKSGFDGEFGRISVFATQERSRLTQGSFVSPGMQPPPPQAGANTHPAGDIPSAEEPASPASHPSPGLNTEQQRAVRSGPHPVLVLAGPGTGKTKTLIGRVEHLLGRGEDPSAILTVTFTRAAARELRERLQSRLPAGTEVPRADTLHALAFAQWRDSRGQPPILMSEPESREAFARALPDIDPAERSAAWDQLARAREQMQVPARLEPHLQAFDRFKTQLGLADYTDLLTAWLDQLRAGTAGIPCSHVLVDEIQDLSVLQGEIIRYLTPEAGTGFFGIGDPDQSIYGFRGAMGDVAECFGRHWPSLETIPLHRNYRSSQTILDFSSRLGSGTALRAHKAGGPGRLTWYQAQSGLQEAHRIARTIKELIGGTGHQQADRSGTEHLAPGDIAVLVRIKALIPPVHKVLHEQGIPCTVPESTPFWEDERIQPILRSVSRFLGLPVDQGKEILDCPDRIIAQGPRKIAEFSARRPDTNQLMWTSRPFKDLCTAYASHGDWNSLMAWIHLEAESAHIRQQAQNVRLLTLHGSKGLEFEAVFLPALEQGILPFSGPDLYPRKKQGAGLKPDIEEEKRLFYVGLTRAQSRLYLSCAQRRKIGRFPVRLHPSPLLSGLDWTQVAKVHTVARTRKREKQLSLLDGLE